LLEIIKAEQPPLLAVEFSGDVNGASQGESERVVAVLGPRHPFAGERVGVAIIEEVVGVEIFVSDVPIAVAMILSTARFADDGHHCAAVAGVLGPVTVEHNLDLADGVHGCDARKHTRRAHVVADHAIHRQNVHVGVGAADGRRVAAVTGAGRIGVGEIGDAGNCAQHRNDVAAARGQVPDLIGCDFCGRLGAVGLDVNGFRRNRHGFAHRAHLQNELPDHDSLIGGNDDAGALEGFEAGMLHFDGVRVGLHGHQVKGSRLVGGCFPSFLGVLTGESDLGVWNGAARWVHYRSTDASRDRHLRKRGAR